MPGDSVLFNTTSMMSVSARRDKETGHGKERLLLVSRVSCLVSGLGSTPQLPAGGVDLRAFALADLHAKAFASQLGDEHGQRFGGWPAVGKTFDLVERDQIHVR